MSRRRRRETPAGQLIERLPAASIEALELDDRPIVSLRLVKLRASLAPLTELQRDCLFLRLGRGLSFTEIAELVGADRTSCGRAFRRGLTIARRAARP